MITREVSPGAWEGDVGDVGQNPGVKTLVRRVTSGALLYNIMTIVNNGVT